MASPLSPQGWPQWGGGPAAAPTACLALSPMATDPPPRHGWAQSLGWTPPPPVPRAGGSGWPTCPGDARSTFGQTVTSLGRAAGQCLSWGAAGHLRCPKGGPLPPSPPAPCPRLGQGRGGCYQSTFGCTSKPKAGGRGAEPRLQHRLHQHVPCQRSPVMGLGLCQASGGQQGAGGQPHASPTLAQAAVKTNTGGANAPGSAPRC